MRIRIPNTRFHPNNFYLTHQKERRKQFVTWNMVRWLPLLVSATTPRSPVLTMSALICWVDRPVELASAFTSTPSPIPSSIPSQAGANLKVGFLFNQTIIIFRFKLKWMLKQILKTKTESETMLRIRDVYPGCELFHPGSRIQNQKDSGSA
jgi:hypothetical protein